MGMRTRSRSRATQRQQSKDAQQPVNITVNIHIHVAQEAPRFEPTPLPPQPRYLTRLQRQRLASLSASTSKLPAPHCVYQPIDKNAQALDFTLTKNSMNERRPVMENPKPKRRRVDVDAVMAELTSMSMGTRKLPLRIGHSTSLSPAPRNPFISFPSPAPSQDLVRHMGRCHLQSSPADDLSIAVSNLQLVRSMDTDMDAALAQFTSMTLHEPPPASESLFLHHLLEKRLSLHG